MVPVPTRLRSPHPAVAALGDDDERLVMPPVLRRRALLILLALAAEAVRRGYEVRDAPRPTRGAKAKWMWSSTASRAPSPSSRSSHSRPTRIAPNVLSSNSGAAGRLGRAAGAIASAGGWRMSWARCSARSSCGRRRTRGARRTRSGPGRSVRSVGERPWRRRRSKLSRPSSPRRFARRRGVGGRRQRWVSTATPWNVVLPVWVATRRRRISVRLDAGWSGHVAMCRGSTR